MLTRACGDLDYDDRGVAELRVSMSGSSDAARRILPGDKFFAGRRGNREGPLLSFRRARGVQNILNCHGLPPPS